MQRHSTIGHLTFKDLNVYNIADSCTQNMMQRWNQQIIEGNIFVFMRLIGLLHVQVCYALKVWYNYGILNLQHTVYIDYETMMPMQ